MNFRVLILLFGLLMNMSCNSSSNTDISALDTTSLPSKSQAEIVDLYTQVDEVDIIFMNPSFSVNAPADMAQDIIKGMALENVPKTACEQMMIAYFKNQGEQIAHIGAFVGNGCAYYVFYKDDKATHVNGMTQYGIDFIQNMLSQAGTQPQ